MNKEVYIVLDGVNISNDYTTQNTILTWQLADHMFGDLMYENEFYLELINCNFLISNDADYKMGQMEIYVDLLSKNMQNTNNKILAAFVPFDLTPDAGVGYTIYSSNQMNQPGFKLRVSKFNTISLTLRQFQLDSDIYYNDGTNDILIPAQNKFVFKLSKVEGA